MSVFTPADVETLAAAGLISPPSSNGTRRLHKRRLHSSSDEESSHLPLTPLSQTSSSSVTTLYATVPDLLISLETLKYLGYNDTAADEIWHRWSTWPSTPPGRFEVDVDGEIRFIDVAVGHLYQFRDRDTWDENDVSWFGFMDLCGIQSEIQNDIMHPVYKRLRLTQSCYFWVSDTIEMRYRGLEAIQRASRERAMAATRAASRAGHSGADGHDRPSSRGPSGSAQGTPRQGERRSVSETMSMAPGLSPDSAFSDACKEAQNIPGFVTLYKGIDQARLDGFFDDSGAIADWETLASDTPTDFLQSVGFYFAVDRDIAEHYACYAKRRATVQSVVIVHVKVPNQLIQGLSSTQLQTTYWPSEEWKKLVWHCRNRKKVPTELRKFRLASVIIGTIAGKPSHVFKAMKGFTQIDEKCVLKTKGGRNAVQYVFDNDEGIEYLQELEPGSVTVHPVSGVEFTQWEEEQSR